MGCSPYKHLHFPAKATVAPAGGYGKDRNQTRKDFQLASLTASTTFSATTVTTATIMVFSKSGHMVILLESRVDKLAPRAVARRTPGLEYRDMGRTTQRLCTGAALVQFSVRLSNLHCSMYDGNSRTGGNQLMMGKITSQRKSKGFPSTEELSRTLVGQYADEFGEMSSRSLSAKIADLDKGRSIWWINRPQKLKLLIAFLELDPEELDIGGKSGRHIIDFPMFPNLTPLDLRREDACMAPLCRSVTPLPRVVESCSRPTTTDEVHQLRPCRLRVQSSSLFRWPRARLGIVVEAHELDSLRRPRCVPRSSFP
ncbi:hypothetical protein SAMN05192563_10385 [Paraburkholderia aspalathi]|uniref:Uncharacterized protein n=1 Tax=Paraburkholderia aspalathi TaxID=1324617 RepID=A0A1I7ENN0_9BURK|nr:hypothetical protein SAMN05192563_10385 [Paraburkholderia aspalathi]